MPEKEMNNHFRADKCILLKRNLDVRKIMKPKYLGHWGLPLQWYNVCTMSRGMDVNVLLQTPHHALRLLMWWLCVTCLCSLEDFANEREQSRHWYVPGRSISDNWWAQNVRPEVYHSRAKNRDKIRSHGVAFFLRFFSAYKSNHYLIPMTGGNWKWLIVFVMNKPLVYIDELGWTPIYNY